LIILVINFHVQAHTARPGSCLLDRRDGDLFVCTSRPAGNAATPAHGGIPGNSTKLPEHGFFPQ